MASLRPQPRRDRIRRVISGPPLAVYKGSVFPSQEASRRTGAQNGRSGLLEDEIAIEKIRIVEMGPAGQFNGMAAALAHTSHRGDAHGKKNERLYPFP